MSVNVRDASGNIVPLSSDTINGTDQAQRLKIVTGDSTVDEGTVSANHPMPVTDLLADQISHLINRLSFLTMLQDSAANLRVNINAGILPTVTTVTTVTTLSTMGGTYRTDMIPMATVNLGAQNLRDHITVA